MWNLFIHVDLILTRFISIIAYGIGTLGDNSFVILKLLGHLLVSECSEWGLYVHSTEAEGKDTGRFKKLRCIFSWILYWDSAALWFIGILRGSGQKWSLVTTLIKYPGLGTPDSRVSPVLIQWPELFKEWDRGCLQEPIKTNGERSLPYFTYNIVNRNWHKNLI